MASTLVPGQLEQLGEGVCGDVRGYAVSASVPGGDRLCWSFRGEAPEVLRGDRGLIARQEQNGLDLWGQRADTGSYGRGHAFFPLKIQHDLRWCERGLRKDRLGRGSQDHEDGGTPCLSGDTHGAFEQSFLFKPYKLLRFPQPARRTRSQNDGSDVLDHAFSAHWACR